MITIGTKNFLSGFVGNKTIESIWIGNVRIYSRIPKLETPDNVSVDETTVSWDAVEHAETYSIKIDGTEIGVYGTWETPQQVGNNVTITQAYAVTQSASNLSVE